MHSGKRSKFDSLDVFFLSTNNTIFCQFLKPFPKIVHIQNLAKIYLSSGFLQMQIFSSYYKLYYAYVYRLYIYLLSTIVVWIAWSVCTQPIPLSISFAPKQQQQTPVHIAYFDHTTTANKITYKNKRTIDEYRRMYRYITA